MINAILVDSCVRLWARLSDRLNRTDGIVRCLILPHLTSFSFENISSTTMIIIWCWFIDTYRRNKENVFFFSVCKNVIKAFPPEK